MHDIWYTIYSSAEAIKFLQYIARISYTIILNRHFSADWKRHFRVPGRHSGYSLFTETPNRLLPTSGDRSYLQRIHLRVASRTAFFGATVTCDHDRQKVKSRSATGCESSGWYDLVRPFNRDRDCVVATANQSAEVRQTISKMCFQLLNYSKKFRQINTQYVDLMRINF